MQSNLPNWVGRSIMVATAGLAVGLVGADFVAAIGNQNRELPADGSQLAIDFEMPRSADVPGGGQTRDRSSAPAASPGSRLAPHWPPAERRAAPSPVAHDDTASSMRFSVVDRDGGRAIVGVGVIGSLTLDAFRVFLTNEAEAVDSLVLDSPGGLLHEALEFGAYVREVGLNTEVAAGAICVSSCPLVLAGGVERKVHEDSVVGVHAAYVRPDTPGTLLEGALGAQWIAGLAMAHLQAMDVSTDVWFHALQTPWTSMYVFTADEMRSFNLATHIDDGTP